MQGITNRLSSGITNGVRTVLGKGAGEVGKFSGSLNGLTSAERTVVNDLLSQGKNVEIIPTTTVQKRQTS